MSTSINIKTVSMFWKRIERLTKSGVMLFDNLSNNQLYELVAAKQNNTLPRYTIISNALSSLPKAFAQKIETLVKKRDRKDQLKALKNVTPEAFTELYESLEFGLETILVSDTYDKFVSNVVKTEPKINTQSLDSIAIQRMRRKFKRDRGIF